MNSAFRRLLTILGVLAAVLNLPVCQAQDSVEEASPSIIKNILKSNFETTRSEGLLLEQPPTYVRFTGKDGLDLSISLMRRVNIDYTLMFWFRSAQSLDQLETDSSILNTRAYLFELAGGAGCYITRTEEVADGKLIRGGPWLRCDPGDIEIELSELPNIQSWMHLTYSAIYRPQSAEYEGEEKSETFVRIDVSRFNLTRRSQAYQPILDRHAYYGAGAPDEVTGVPKDGFRGDYRQFWLTAGTLDEDKVPLLMHQYKVMDFSTLAYYRFDETVLRKREQDSFRLQSYSLLSIENPSDSVSEQLIRQYGKEPKFITEDVAAPFCNSIPQEYLQVPQFLRGAGDKYEGIKLPTFDFDQKYIAYTVSFWMKNFGKHTFSSDPKTGRERNQIFSLDESFAVYYSSQTTFNVYVYAADNFDEINSDPVFLPLYEWVNIQISLHYDLGITVMTFNQNGDRMQIVQTQARLGEQYPKGSLSLFQAFEGVPYQLHIWERFIQLPVDFSDENLARDQIVSFDFTKDNYDKKASFEGWRSLVSGGDLPAVEGEGFEFIYSNVPSGVDFKRVSKIGQLEATETQWNGVTCPTPETNMMYLSGLGAKFSMAVAVDTTEDLTVEFWVRPDVEKFNVIGTAQPVTYLFTMQGRLDPVTGGKDPDTMVVYVEDGVLKCAPFGISDEESILTFEGVNPLTVNKWQHISCSMRRQKFVKGEYLAININADGTPDDTFAMRTLRPQTFSKSIYRQDGGVTLPNFSSLYRWTVILGNNAVEQSSLYFYGSYKDVRIWRSLRSDADLYSYRFNQVSISDDLAANIKFMDGNPNIYNNALLNEPGIKFAVIEPTLELRPTDGQNIICAPDTYFNPSDQKCSRNPYSTDVIITYTVSNSVQHGHNMLMQKIAQSTMFLPSAKYQPQTSTSWSVADQEAVQAKYFDQDNSRQTYNFDPIFMGDFKPYNFKLEMSDVVDHQFFVIMDQTIVPRKCILIADQLTDQSQVSRSVTLGESDSIRDITFDFSVKRIDGCKDEYENEIIPTVKIETQPPLQQSAIDKILQTFDAETQSFKIVIPKELQQDRVMPKNIPIEMVFRLFWTAEELAGTDAAVQFQDIVYSLTLAQDIYVDYSYEGGQFIDLNQDGNLLISAANSYVVMDQASGTSGLTFTWSCKVADAQPNAYPGLQSACEHWNGSSVIEIPKELATAQGFVGVPVIITVTVASIESSVLEGDAAQYVQFSKSRQFTWISTTTPDFKILLPQHYTANADIVLVSQPQQIVIEPIGGWRPIDGYQFQYYVSLKDNEQDRIAIPFDMNLNTFEIPAYTLEYESVYELQVTVSNLDLSQAITPQTNIIEFRTGSQPVLASLKVTPDSGVMYDTEFTVTLEGTDLSPVQPLSFVLYGVLSEDPVTELRLNNRKELDSAQASFSQTMQLPVLVGIRAEVKDPTGEVFSITTPVSVEQGGESWTQSLQNRQQEILAESSIDPQEASQVLWQTFQFIGTQANVDARKDSQDPDPVKAKQAVDDAIQVNKLIADSAFTEVQEMFLETDDPVEAEKLSTIVSTIDQTSEFNEFLDLDILQKNVETLEYSLRFENLMPQINRQEEKRKEFVSAVGNVMSATATKAQVEQFQAKYKLETGEEPPVIVWTTESRRLQADNSALARALQEAEDSVDEPEVVTDDDKATSDATDARDDSNGEVATYETQSLMEYRQLIRKMITVKNRHLDQLCEVLTANERMSIQTGQLEAYAQQVLVDAQGNYSTDSSLGLFTSSSQQVSLRLPLNTIMQRSLELSQSRQVFGESLEWVCLQASFIKADANPVAGYEVSQQYYHKGQFIIQVGSLDNLQERLIDETGLRDLEEDPFEIQFNMELTEANQVYDGQTVCSHYNGNQQNMAGQQWSFLKYDADQLEGQGQTALEDCATIYNYPDQLACRCSYLTNFYYTVITDLDLTLNEKAADDIESTRGILYAIIIPLGLIGLILPGVMVLLDQRDYQRIEDNIYPVDDYTIAKLECARDYLCKQEIYYKEKEISRYLQLQEDEFRSGSCTAFMVYHRTLHPYFSLFSQFDYRYKRLTRLSFFICQMSLVTLLIWLAYSRDFEDRGWTDWMGPHRWLYVSLCLSVLMLPLPMRCCCWFKTQMYLLKEDKFDVYEDGDEEHVNLARAPDTQPDDNEAPTMSNRLGSRRSLSHRQSNSSARTAGAAHAPKRDGNDETDGEAEWDDVRPALFDRWLQCKLVGILSIYIIWGTTLYVTYILSNKASENTIYFDPGFIELTAEEATELTWCWYFSIFVWGFLVNELRIGLIALLAPIRAKAIFDRREKLMDDIAVAKKALSEAKNGEERTEKEKDLAEKEAIMVKFDKGFWTKCSCATTVLIPPESVEIALDVIYTVDIKKTEHDPEVKYSVKAEQQAKFERALQAIAPREDDKSEGPHVQFGDSPSVNPMTSNRGLIPNQAAIDVTGKTSGRKSLLRKSTKLDKGDVPGLQLAVMADAANPSSKRMHKRKSKIHKKDKKDKAAKKAK